MPDVVQVEPTIAVDPADPGRMIAAAIGLRQPHAPDWQDHQTLVVYGTEDGGSTWTHRAVGALPESWTAGDPWLAWLAGGRALLSGIAGTAITRQGETSARARLFVSHDDGVTWEGGGDTPFQPGLAEDHPVLASGEVAGQTVIYAVATHAASRYEGIDVARVGPTGERLELLPPLRFDGGIVNLGGAVVDASGLPVVSFFSMSPPRSLWAGRFDASTGTWSVSTISESILPVGFPPLAAGPAGRDRGARIYAAWVESDDQVSMRVLLASSADGGASWSVPTQVHHDMGAVVRTLPALAVAPDGAVAVVWQDQRHADGRQCFDLYGTVSTDAGSTFMPEVRISTATACVGDFQSNGAAAARFRLGGGDYQGLVALGPSTFQAVWSDARTGRYQVWTARLRVP
jgi:hypothetical protein